MDKYFDDGQPLDDFDLGGLNYSEHEQEVIQQQTPKRDYYYDLNNPEKLQFFLREEEEDFQHQHSENPYEEASESIDQHNIDEHSSQQKEEVCQVQVCEIPNPNSELPQQSSQEVELQVQRRVSFKQKNYAELVDTTIRLLASDWLDYNSPSAKMVPIKNMTPICFWFIICAQYFPKSICQQPQSMKEAFEKTLKYLQFSKIIRTQRIENIEIGENDELNQECGEFIEKLYENFDKNVSDPADSKINRKQNYDIEDDEFIIQVRKKLYDFYKSKEHLFEFFQQEKPDSDSEQAKENFMLEMILQNDFIQQENKKSEG